jgi:hypothetical protein
MVINECPFCKGKDFKEVQKKEIKVLKCTACGRIIPKPQECTGDECKL